MMIELRLIGEGIGGSLTPALHEAEARAQGLDLRYQLADIQGVEFRDMGIAEILNALEGAGVRGANVTYPFKSEVLKYLDEISPDAKAVGAVNTVRFEGGKRKGYNTDIYGFAQMMRMGLPEMEPRHPLLIGAGGAGGAILQALADLGVSAVSLTDLDAQKARDLAARMAPIELDIAVVDCEPPSLQGVDGVINATPMGMAKYPGMPLHAELLRPEFFVADIVYFPLETALMKAARKRGCVVVSGALMAVAQAAQAFEIFTGHKADEARMFESFAQIRKEKELVS